MVDICGYELPTNLQNFTQKNLNRNENIPKSFRGGVLFLKHPGVQYINYNLQGVNALHWHKIMKWYYLDTGQYVAKLNMLLK